MRSFLSKKRHVQYPRWLLDKKLNMINRVGTPVGLKGEKIGSSLDCAFLFFGKSKCNFWRFYYYLTLSLRVLTELCSND